MNQYKNLRSKHEMRLEKDSISDYCFVGRLQLIALDTRNFSVGGGPKFKFGFGL
jgi:hypothetical protein